MMFFWFFAFGYLKAAALCRRPLLVDSARCYDNYDYAFFVGFNGTLKAYEGRPKTPVFGFNHRRTGRSKSCQKLCARKERASAAQGTRKVTVLKGFMY